MDKNPVQEQLQILSGKVDTLITNLEKIEHHITGGLRPDSGMIVRMAMLEKKQEDCDIRREKTDKRLWRAVFVIAVHVVAVIAWLGLQFIESIKGN